LFVNTKQHIKQWQIDRARKFKVTIDDISMILTTIRYINSLKLSVIR
jgi:hypothetical protein